MWFLFRRCAIILSRSSIGDPRIKGMNERSFMDFLLDLARKKNL